MTRNHFFKKQIINLLSLIFTCDSMRSGKYSVSSVVRSEEFDVTLPNGVRGGESHGNGI